MKNKRHITRTFQTRLSGDTDVVRVLNEQGEKHGHIKRSLYAVGSRTGLPMESFRVEFCAKYAIPARIFNAIVIDLKGMISSKHEKAKYDLEGQNEKLAKYEERLASWKKKFVGPERKKRPSASDYKSRDRILAKISRIQAQIHRLNTTISQEYPKICFGSRDLAHKQNLAEANGYKDKAAYHAKWLKQWRDKRSGNFQIMGSSAENAGNLSCVATINKDKSISLKLALIGGGKLDIHGIRFPHGHEEVLRAIELANVECKRSLSFQSETKRLSTEYASSGEWPEDVLDDGGDPKTVFSKQRRSIRAKEVKPGAAISYRFLRDEKGWLVFVTIHQYVDEAPKADFKNGCLGVDMNVDHLAISLVDASGKHVFSQRIDTHVQGKSSGQRKALYRDAAKEIVKMAVEHGVPVAIERLDFSRKRSNPTGSAKQNRMVSGFATTMFSDAIISAARRAGVALVKVNPAYTSIIGSQYAVDLGITVHQAAAWAIARRAMDISEKTRTGARVSLIGDKPVWIEVKESDPQSRIASKSDILIAFSSEMREARKARLRARPTGKQRRSHLRANRSLDEDRQFLEGIIGTWSDLGAPRTLVV